MSETETTKIALTQYSHAAGCGCKIAPQVLEEILKSSTVEVENKKLMVGNKSNDDAAVYDLGNGTALISTTDFFMPILDDAFDFGRVAAANAISDVYAMGGTPTLALAILGWPVNKLPTALAQQVLEGARSICREAGIPLAGGHSIDSLEPMFGLSVNGLINLPHLKQNNTAKVGDVLFLTKNIGTGILATAQKRKLLKDEDQMVLVKQLTTLNSFGEKAGKLAGVSAMTDVTGFGLLGHLVEMAEGSGLSAELSYEAVPKFESLPNYLSQNSVPDSTFRNWNAYSTKVEFLEGVNVAEAFSVLPDPQTNGGLLIAVRPEAAEELVKLLKSAGLDKFTRPIGKMVEKTTKVILVGK